MSNQLLTAQIGELPEMNEDEVIKFTRGVRLKAIGEIVSKNANNMPTETSDRIFFTNLLNGLDSQAMNVKKIAAEQKNADNTAGIIAELLHGLDKKSVFRNTGEVIDVTARVLPTSLPDAIQNPGEMEVAPPQLDYATFVKSQGRDPDLIGAHSDHPESD